MNILEKYTKFKKGNLANKIGVYSITNRGDNTTYIGESKNLEVRFIEHLRRLSTNRHVNSHLQNAVNKYGIENFEFEVIELCNLEDTKIREHYWVDYLRESGTTFYNIKPTDPIKTNLRSKETTLKIYQTKKRIAEKRGYWQSEEAIRNQKLSRKGYTHSDETRKKIGIKSLGRKLPKSDKFKEFMSIIAKEKNFGGQNKRRVLQLTKGGSLIKEWPSISSIVKELGFSISSIIHVCRKRRKTSRGFIWRYADENL